MAFDGNLNEVRTLRRILWENGYPPIAVYSPGAMDRNLKPIKGAGKRPVGNDWRGRALRDPPADLARKVTPDEANTGIVCGEVIALDVDVLVQEITDEIVAKIETTLSWTPLSRIGLAPKIILCYRAEEPFPKLATKKYRLPDGSEAQLEILAAGQQFVAYGTHPDTLQPFEWLAGSPCEVPLADLPTISPMQARDLIGEADVILKAAGGVEIKPESEPVERKKKPESKSNRRKDPSEPGDFFRAVNDAALDDIAAWAELLGFHDRGNSGWRLSSDEIGRPLEEDLSIHPDGIRDFGEEKPLTAIDVVIKLGGAADVVQAAHWLCGRLGKEPAAFGWRDSPTPETEPPLEFNDNAPPPDNASEPADSTTDDMPKMEGPRPLRRELPPAPPFPIHALNCAPALKNAALAIEAATQAPLAICGNSVLAAASMCAQAHGNVEMPYGSLRPLSLFELTVAGSGERKSAADELALKPLHDREAELRLEYEVACREHRADVEAWAAHKAHLQQTFKKDRSALRTALVALGPEPEGPLRPLLLVDNPTVEGLEVYADIGQPSFGLFTAEGGKLIGGHLMSEENRMKAGATLNLFWDGAPVPRLRKDRATKLPGRRLALHIMLQPEVAARMLSDPTLKDLGTLARCLLVAPDSTAGTRFWRARPDFIDSSLQTYRTALLELLRREPRKGSEPNELAPLALPLTEEARRLWIKFYNEVELQLGSDAPWAPIRAFGSKLPEQAARIAGVLALVVEPDNDAIGVEAMEGGIQLARFYAAEILRLADAGMTNPDLILAEKLLRWLHADPSRYATHLGEIYQYGPSGIRDKTTALRIVRILKDHGWLRGLKKGTEVDGRRRQDAWEVVR